MEKSNIETMVMRVNYVILVANDNSKTMELMTSDFMILIYENDEIKITDLNKENITSQIGEGMRDMVVCQSVSVSIPLRIIEDGEVKDVEIGHSPETDLVIGKLYKEIDKEFLRREEKIGEIISAEQ